MAGIILIFVLLMLLCLPGLTLWHRYVSSRFTIENLATGLCFGFAFATASLYLLTLLSLTTALWIWGALVVMAAVHWVPLASKLKLALSGSGYKAWVFGILAITALVRFLPTFVDEYPRGWDPYSHLLLIQEILLTNGHVYTWEPYDNIPLRYPIGSHLLIGLLTRDSGMPAHIVFNLVLVWLSILVCFQLFALVSVAQQDREFAFFTCAIYCLLPILGSAGYFAWGGVPNLAGIYLTLGCLTFLCEREPHPAMAWGLPFFFVAICLLNEHALGAAFVVILGVGIWCLRRPEERARSRLLLKAGVASMALGAGYYAWRSPKDYKLSETSLTTYNEEFYSIDFLMSSVGPVYVVFTFLGLWLLYARVFPIKIHPILSITTGVWILIFAALEYGGRIVTAMFFQQSFGPASPGRFFTNAITTASIFAAIFLIQMMRLSGWGRRRMFWLLLFLGATNIGLYKSYLTPQTNRAYLATCEWLKTNTPPTSMILEGTVRTAYLCRRPTSGTPYGSSELWTRATTRYALLCMQSDILAGRVSKVTVPNPVVLMLPGPNARTVFRRLHQTNPGYLEPLWSAPQHEYIVFSVNQDHAFAPIAQPRSVPPTMPR